MALPDIYKGQKYEIQGEIYELSGFRVTGVRSQKNFITIAFFKSYNQKSKNPFFEENITRVINNPIFKIIPKK